MSMFLRLAFLFFVGSVQLITKLKKFAEGNNLVVKFEAIKLDIRNHHEEMAYKYHFFRPFDTDRPLLEHLRDMRDSFEKRVRNGS